jgi:hypothetical protein
MRIYSVILAMVTLTLAASTCPAEVPLLLNYQGSVRLAGSAPSDTTVQVSFAIYDSDTGGALLWSETHEASIDDGRFHVLLGSRNALPDSLFTAPERYLGFTISGSPEMAPRHRIVSVAYAIRAAEADDVPGRDISPRSILLSQGAAGLDSTGTLAATKVEAQTVTAGSLAVGGVGVIDRAGRWVGARQSDTGSGEVVDTVIVGTVNDTLSFSHDTRWRTISELNTPFSLDGQRRVEVELLSVMSAQGGALLKLSVHQLSGFLVVSRYEDIGNLSGLHTGGGHEFQSTTVSNKAYVDLDAGDYRVVVERLVAGNWCKLHTAQTVITAYRNLGD